MSISVGKDDFKEIYRDKERLKNLVVSGVEGIEEVMVVKRDANYVILAAGSNLKEIMQMKGVNPDKVLSNNIQEIAEVLGIEAARHSIMAEISKVIESQGLDIDKRHLKLVADAMCNTGEVKGVTRMGIISEKTSILARASFETPIKQFVNATLKTSKDELASVIENIMLNQPVPIGTGLPGLLVKVTGPLVDKELEEKKKSKKKD